MLASSHVFQCHDTRCGDTVDSYDMPAPRNFWKSLLFRWYLRFLWEKVISIGFFYRKHGSPPRSPRFEYSNRFGVIEKQANNAIHASMDAQLMASWSPLMIPSTLRASHNADYFSFPKTCNSASTYRCFKLQLATNIMHYNCVIAIIFNM